jgi:L-seryl-tRNA(Ser) seleniumtransferase
MDRSPARPPALDKLLELPGLRELIGQHGRTEACAVARDALAAWRNEAGKPFDLDEFVSHCGHALTTRAAPHLRAVLNLTGTVLHTNLGRAPLPQEALDAVAAVMSQPSTLEYRLADGARGERDDHIDELLRELTGAQAATAVNNNAAAVLLVLAALAEKKEVIVSRGELVEIGGAFRIPDIMRRANARLVEVGTTNRTHLRDFEAAIGPKTGLVMKVHASNYSIEGFTASVPMTELAALCRARGVPLAEDLGSGALVDMTRWNLPAEPTPRQSLAAGAQVVTFSGDKLLGGPQAGLIVGDKALVDRIRKNPLKRALRLDKMTLAALEAVLKLYRNPDRLAQRLPTLQLLTRPLADIQAQAARLAPRIAQALGARASVQVLDCRSQVGSGSLPVDRLPSACIAIGPPAHAKRAGSFPDRVALALRTLPLPVIGRIEDGQLRLDLRCLGVDAEAGLVDAFVALRF